MTKLITKEEYDLINRTQVLPGITLVRYPVVTYVSGKRITSYNYLLAKA